MPIFIRENAQISQWQWMWREFRPWILILFLLIAAGLPCLIVGNKTSAGIFYFVIIIGCWIIEPIPMSVASLLPFILAPMLGIMSFSDVAAHYAKEGGYILFGGVIIALGIESSNLHRRISLLVVQLCGKDIRMTLLGFMIPTWFLSMWINNSSATVLMMTTSKPILEGLEEQLKKKGEEESREDREKLDRIAKAMVLGICYSSSFGGIATLIGTPVNTVLVGIMENKYGQIQEFNFGSWALFAFPISFCMLWTSWLILMLVFLGPKEIFRGRANKTPAQLRMEATFRTVIDHDYALLGPMNFQEYSCMFLVVLAAILWSTRNLGDGIGWFHIFKQETLPSGKMKDYVTNAAVSCFIGILMLIWPAKNPISTLIEIRKGGKYYEMKTKDLFLLPWEKMQSKFPWGLMYTMGGSFALSDGISRTGLLTLLGGFLSKFTEVPMTLLFLILMCLTSILTNVASNIATSTMAIPLALQMAHAYGKNPLFFGLATTITSTFAFSLPIGTPPNLFAYNTKRVTIKDFLIAGSLITIVGNVLVWVATYTYAVPLFHLDTFPKWARLNKTQY